MSNDAYNNIGLIHLTSTYIYIYTVLNKNNSRTCINQCKLSFVLLYSIHVYFNAILSFIHFRLCHTCHHEIIVVRIIHFIICLLITKTRLFKYTENFTTKK